MNDELRMLNVEVKSSSFNIQHSSFKIILKSFWKQPLQLSQPLVPLSTTLRSATIGLSLAGSVILSVIQKKILAKPLKRSERFGGSLSKN